VTTTSEAAPESGVKHLDMARTERGLAHFRERGHEIVEVSPGVYRVPGSKGAAYMINTEHEYCSCPDRISPCKHMFAVTIAEAKRRCRRRRTAPRRPSRRHGEISPRPTEHRRAPGDIGGPGRADGSLRGILTDLGRLDQLAERLGV